MRGLWRAGGWSVRVGGEWWWVTVSGGSSGSDGDDSDDNIKLGLK